MQCKKVEGCMCLRRCLLYLLYMLYLLYHAVQYLLSFLFLGTVMIFLLFAFDIRGCSYLIILGNSDHFVSVLASVDSDSDIDEEEKDAPTRQRQSRGELCVLVVLVEVC